MKLEDESGNSRTLSSGVNAYERLLPPPRQGADCLLLGLGPDPAEAARALQPEGRVFYVESDDFSRAMPLSWRDTIPEDWKAAPPEEAVRLSATCEVWTYRQNLRLFNTFWGPLIAMIQAKRLLRRGVGPSRRVIFPADDSSLLVQEVDAALRSLEYTPVRVPEQRLASTLPSILSEDRPACLLSVNGRGLDADGQLFRLAQACGVPTAIWIVDNPWHLLNGWRLPWWREAHLFITDEGFVSPLREHGAAHVAHLPLGAWMPPPDKPFSGSPLQSLVFVGRSAFPDKRKFFSGLRCDPELLHEARHVYEAEEKRPDFAWWCERLDMRTCWPGKAIRQAGLYAETASMAHRAFWLDSARPLGLTIFGDEGWRALLCSAPEVSGMDLRPPLDYYSGLSAVYAAARYSLNITSLLLPNGLTQRHFDVWSAGGFLLTDGTPGLALFPNELTEPITIHHPRHLAETMARFERDPALYQDLRNAWQQHLATHHTLAQRLTQMFQHIKSS